MSFDKIKRNYGNNHKIKNIVPAFDALETIGQNPLNVGQARLDYIRDRAIQVNAPVPENSITTAMDSQCSNQQYPAQFDYVNSHVLSYFIASSSFIGYYAMALMSQNWLIMKGCSSAATDAMKKGYELTRNDGETLDKKEVRQINKLDKKYHLKDNIIEGETFNNIFGIRHILFKHTDPNFDYSEPFNPDAFKGGKYAGMAQIDPYWITPILNDIDITDPTAINYYEPTFWFINSKRYHKSHFVILRGQHIADYLKPTYRYGGISLVQRLYERVYAGERTANELPQLAMTKRLGVRKTDLVKALANKAQFIKNLNVMNEYRDNYGVQVVGKDEEISQLETSLADLDKVMWANYHLVASIIDRPVSKVFGTGFGGLGTGETDDDYDISNLEALQSGHLEDIAYGHYERLMPSEFGQEMDLDIVWLELKVMGEVERAEVNNKNANTAALLQGVGSIDAIDERERLIGDKYSGYSGMEKLEVIEAEPEDKPAKPNAMDSHALDFVKEEGGKWFVHSESGKKLSEGYESKKEADKRLGQIEYFKHAEDNADDKGYASVNLFEDDAVHINAHLKSIGIDGCIYGTEMHATLMYSKDSSINGEADSTATYNASIKGEPKIIGKAPWRALVVELDSDDLRARHEQIKSMGGVHSYDEFLPHLSVKYDPTDEDLQKLKESPINGKLRFSDESFKAIK